MTETKIINPGLPYKPEKRWIYLIEAAPIIVSDLIGERPASFATINGKEYNFSDIFRRKINIPPESVITFNAGGIQSFISIEADHSDEYGDIRLGYSQPQLGYIVTDLPFITRESADSWKLYVPAFTSVLIQTESGSTNTVIKVYPKFAISQYIYYLKTFRAGAYTPDVLLPFKFFPAFYKLSGHNGYQIDDLFIDGNATLIYQIKL